MRKILSLLSITLLLWIGVCWPVLAQTRARWPERQARAWYARQPWLVGSNYAPANAINEIEMWQAETFDPAAIDKDWGWAEGLGMNTMRVFKGVVGAFAKDKRVLAWDVWNEPDNLNGSSYGKLEPANKVELALALLPKVFAWTRAAGATQPLTCGVWKGDWSSESKMTAMDKLQIELSDVVSFHNYDDAAQFEQRIQWLQRYNRPILCTEHMARGNKSTFEGSLPVAKKYNVAAINWGFVKGKTQTHLPWDSWLKPYADREPSIWFHEIFQPDGAPYRAEEVELIRKLTGAARRKSA